MTQQIITDAQARLFSPTGLELSQLHASLETTLGAGADYADLYFQHSYNESWSLEDGIVKRGFFAVDQGVGARAISGEHSALAFSDDLSWSSVRSAIDLTRAVVNTAPSGPIEVRRRPVTSITPVSLYEAVNPIMMLDAQDKVEILRKVDHLARSRDPRVRQVQANLTASFDTVLVLGSDGRLAVDNRPLVNLFIYIFVESNGRRAMAHGGGGGRYDLSRFSDEEINRYVNKTVDAALVQLDAIDAPAGTMTVVCGAGWPGILLHEAVGHGLEGDFNRKGSSAFAGRVGQQVAARGVTIVDDGTLPGLRGSLTVDDEGNPSACTPLIEDGILTGYMHDDLSARLLGVPPTGNGRRQSYAHEPLPRMTNTYMLAGQYDPEEIISSVKKGIYTVDFSGGQVDITSGRFTFAATQAFLIEDGRITAPIKGATLIGNGPESLKHVCMVGNDLALDDGFATCGKEGQSLPVGVGQPTIRIDNMTVGGTA